MFSVIRFTSLSVARDVHERIGGQLNVQIPGAYKGLRHVGDGFSSDLSKSPGWWDHRIAIIEFIRAGGAAIAEARRVGLDVCVDVAIEPEDLALSPVFCVHADPELTRSLSDMDVSLEFSIY